MEFRIGNNNEYLFIKDISLEYPQSNFYRGTIEIKINGFSSNLDMSGEIFELSGLSANLKKLYEKLNHQFVFGNLENNIELTFNPTNTGQIELNGYLRNDYGTGKLEFKIVTDQSYLPETINQLEIVLSDLKINTK